MTAAPPPSSAYAVANSSNPARAAGSQYAHGGGGFGNLTRWNVQSNSLPDPATIKAVHVYDFDNTVFQTPLPNRKIWTNESYTRLMEPSYFANGGWWHDSRILAATGQGIEIEEPRAWKGWWNENIVELIQLSMRQKDAMTILLTGRSVEGFSSLVLRIMGSRKLEFDIVGLKPDTDPNGNPWNNTLAFKESFLGELLDCYKEAEDFRIYEDRVRHVRAFEEFAQGYVDSYPPGSRRPLRAEIIQVAEQGTMLDAAVEIQEVQKMIDDHNATVEKNPNRAPGALRLNRTVFYTGYLLESADSTALLNELEIPAMVSRDPDVKYMGNNVLIAPRPASAGMLRQAGGRGTKVEFEVMGIGQLEDRVWAAKVKPVDPNFEMYTENPVPIIVLACRRQLSRPADANRIKEWTVPRKTIRFETTIGEKALLRIEDENEAGVIPSSPSHKRQKREQPLTPRPPPGPPERGGYSSRRGESNHYSWSPNYNRGDRREYHTRGHDHTSGHHDRDRDHRDRDHYRSNRGGGEHRGHRGGRGGRGSSRGNNRGYRGGPRGGGGTGRDANFDTTASFNSDYF